MASGISAWLSCRLTGAIMHEVNYMKLSGCVHGRTERTSLILTGTLHPPCKYALFFAFSVANCYLCLVSVLHCPGICLTSGQLWCIIGIIEVGEARQVRKDPRDGAIIH